MKKLLKTFLLIMITLLAFSFASCSNDTLCIPCEDKDNNLICDRCGNAVLECLPCIDENLDHCCDRCGEELVSKEDLGFTLELTSPPARAKFYTGEAFVADGMTISAKYADGTVTPVDDFILGAPATLDTSVEKIFVYYGGAVISVPVEVSEIPMIGVADATRADVGETLFIDGYYVGNTTSGILVKDVKYDNVLEVRGNIPNYSNGDRIRFEAVLAKDTSARITYLEYFSDNSAANVYSSDNTVSALFSGVTGVASWDRMTRTFKQTSFKIGTYYKIYADRIYVVENEDGSLTVHLNDEATDAASVSPDGSHTVNIVSGTKGSAYLKTLLGAYSGNLPGKCFSGVIHALSLGVDGDSYDLTVLDPSWVELGQVMTPKHAAISEVAHAFYYKGSYIHYDQYGTRRNINPSPEAATADERLHIDCSTFVNAVYYEAFGENVQPYPTTERSPQTGVMTEYAKNFNGINPDVIGYYETADLDTEEKKSEFVEMIRATLEVGDVIVYRRASSGHAIIYVGNGYFLHSTGASYEYAIGDPHSAYDQVDPKGTVSKLYLSTYLDDKDNGRYVLAPNVVTISILRPLARGLEINDVTEARMSIPGISLEKSSSAPHRSAVRSGDTVVYTVTLKNNGSSAVSDVTLTDFIPEGAVFVGGMRGITVDNGTISYITSLEAGEEINITYAVKIIADEPCDIVSRGDVNGVPLNEIFNTVSVSMTEINEKALVELAKAFFNEERSFDDPLKAAKALYSEALGMNFTECAEALALIDALIDTEGNTFNSQSADADLLVRGLYGGYDIRLGYRVDNDRSRLVREHNLSVGDVVIGEYGDDTVVELYVYLGAGEFLFASSETSTLSLFTIESSLTKNLLVSLISFDRYVVIRPSQK